MKIKKKISAFFEQTRKTAESSSFRKNLLMLLLNLAVVAGVAMAWCVSASASINIDLGTGTAETGTSPLDLLFLLAFISLLPSLLLLMTSFTRIIIILSFLRNAMGTQQSPPNQVLTGLALFLTIFIMTPVIDQINEEAYKPYKQELITQEEFFAKGSAPIKKFMLRQAYEDDLDLFMTMAEEAGQIVKADFDETEKLLNLRLNVIVPAFVLSELKRAFIAGFLLYIPFLIIDIIVASTLMSMGMVMLPPSMISLPFKLMIFVLVDGWSLLIGALVAGFA
jgi:flagellar biosynthetic protein FliP